MRTIVAAPELRRCGCWYWGGYWFGGYWLGGYWFIGYPVGGYWLYVWRVLRRVMLANMLPRKIPVQGELPRLTFVVLVGVGVGCVRLGWEREEELGLGVLEADPTRWVLTDPVDCLGETLPDPPFGLGIGISARRRKKVLLKARKCISPSLSASHPFLLTTRCLCGNVS